MFERNHCNKVYRAKAVLSEAEGTPPKLNPKSEARNPKQTKHSIRKSKTSLVGIFCFLIIGIWFEFRNSNFEFFHRVVVPSRE
jgi:hypothetical protein